jgi:hypothetical protein
MERDDTAQRISEATSHTTLSHAVDSAGFSWTGHLSAYFHDWIERFNRLKQDQDPDIQRIAEEGLKWATAEYERQCKEEKSEEISGWD